MQRFVGVLVAAQSAEIAPRVAGVLAAVHVGVGDAVAAGQLVATLDRAPLENELRAAEAGLAAAAAATRTARVDLEDARRRAALEARAVEAGVSAAQSLEEARLAAARAEAALHRARSIQAAEAARAQSARDQLAAGGLRAPFEGVIAARYRDAGNRVEAGAPIVRVEARGGTRLRFAVPPADAARVGSAMRVHVAIDTLAAPLTAVVEQVSPTIDSASGLIFVEATLAVPPPGAALRSGLAAWVMLPEAR